jgi:hypothetical protein
MHTEANVCKNGAVSENDITSCTHVKEPTFLLLGRFGSGEAVGDEGAGILGAA